MTARQDLLDLLSHQGEVERADLPTALKRAGDALANEGIVAVRWAAVDWDGHWHGGPPRKVFYDPAWRKPEGPPRLRAIKGGKI